MTQPASTAEPRWESEIKQILLKILVSVTVTSTHRSQTICLFQNAWEAGEQPEAGPEQRPADELPPLLVCQLVGSAEGQFVILSVTWIRTLRSLCAPWSFIISRKILFRFWQKRCPISGLQVVQTIYAFNTLLPSSLIIFHLLKIFIIHNNDKCSLNGRYFSEWCMWWATKPRCGGKTSLSFPVSGVLLPDY